MQRRAGDALPKQVQQVIETGSALVTEAKGLGRPAPPPHQRSRQKAAASKSNMMKFEKALVGRVELTPPRHVPVALPRRERLERVQPDLLAWCGVPMPRLRYQTACLESQATALVISLLYQSHL